MTTYDNMISEKMDCWIDIQWKPCAKHEEKLSEQKHEDLAAKHKAFRWRRDDIPEDITLYFR